MEPLVFWKFSRPSHRRKIHLFGLIHVDLLTQSIKYYELLRLLPCRFIMCLAIGKPYVMDVFIGYKLTLQ